MTSVTYIWDFSFLWMYRWLLLKGLGFTILYTIGSILFGLMLGLLVGVLRLSGSRLVNFPLIAYIETFRCTPLLVQIIWFYYAFPVLVGVDCNPGRPLWCWEQRIDRTASSKLLERLLHRHLDSCHQSARV